MRFDEIWDLMKFGVDIRVFHVLQTDLNRIRDFTGSRVSISDSTRSSER